MAAQAIKRATVYTEAREPLVTRNVRDGPAGFAGRGKGGNRNGPSPSLGVGRSATHGHRGRYKSGIEKGVRNGPFLKFYS